MELFRSTVPLIKGAMSRQSSYEVDDSWHYRLTPMVMGILVRQICNAERKTLTQEIERIITDKIEALSFNSGGVPTPKPSQRTSTPSEDTQQATQAITINIGDTKGNGHIESQATASGTAESACFPPRDGLRQNAPLNPQFSSPQLDTPTRQILQAPRTTFREDSTPSRFSNTKKPKEQSGSYQPIPKSEDEWSTTSEDTDTENGLEDPCHSPSVPSSSIFTATTRRSAQSLTRGPSSPLDFSTSDTFQFRGIKSLNLPSYPGAS
ncbi:hypothetical protein NW769_009548 [Fusarium oxysporum]|nr:hypothetical protein NW769_009548 [Fusarium oxysporum]